MWHSILWLLGLTSQQDWPYMWWSGPGAVLASLLSTWSAIGLVWWNRRCHVKRCWRTGRFAVQGTPWVVCYRHHPKESPDAEDIVLNPEPEEIKQAVDKQQEENGK